eukprot:scaffold81035_cov41-Prasinocladus_malaysianus.AAC.1
MIVSASKLRQRLTRLRYGPATGNTFIMSVMHIPPELAMLWWQSTSLMVEDPDGLPEFFFNANFYNVPVTSNLVIK